MNKWLCNEENKILHWCLKRHSEQDVTLSVSSSIPMSEMANELLLSEPDKVEWKPANLSGMALGDTLVLQYNDELN